MQGCCGRSEGWWSSEILGPGSPRGSLRPPQLVRAAQVSRTEALLAAARASVVIVVQDSFFHPEAWEVAAVAGCFVWSGQSDAHVLPEDPQGSLRGPGPWQGGKGLGRQAACDPPASHPGYRQVGCLSSQS